MFDIFIFSFLVALTGALSPGPLLTFTIYKSLREKKGYIATLYILLGHATIELLLIFILLAGASFFFQNLIFLAVVGVLGGSLLIVLGFLLIKDVYKSKVKILQDSDVENTNLKGFKGNSYIGGILVSLSNPFWEFWWAVIGLGFMISFNIGFHNPLGLVLFFVGHELGDFIWYLPLSFFICFGGRSLNPKIYKYVLICCGLFMIVFGIYMILNTLINLPVMI